MPSPGHLVTGSDARHQKPRTATAGHWFSPRVAAGVAVTGFDIGRDENRTDGPAKPRHAGQQDHAMSLSEQLKAEVERMTDAKVETFYERLLRMYPDLATDEGDDEPDSTESSALTEANPRDP